MADETGDDLVAATRAELLLEEQIEVETSDWLAYLRLLSSNAESLHWQDQSAFSMHPAQAELTDNQCGMGQCHRYINIQR